MVGGGWGWGEGVRGKWIFFYFESKFKIFFFGVAGGGMEGG